ncbi:MAG: ribonuclease HI family protein [bacterium]|nr:ribonuclease HI family protein [bacterium]
MKNEITIYTDGGSRGNPGPAGIGYVIKDSDGNNLEIGSKFIGTKTNNEAEYLALISALEQAKKLQPEKVNIIADSELMIKQLRKEYKVKQDHLKILLEQVETLSQNFSKITYSHVKRELNKEADLLVNQALDNQAIVNPAG